MEARDVVDDFCDSAGAMADRVDRLSRDRLVHSSFAGSSPDRPCDPADHRAPTSRLVRVGSSRSARLYGDLVVANLLSCSDQSRIANGSFGSFMDCIILRLLD